MEISMAKKEPKKEIDYKSLIRKKKLPILTLDERWHSVFPQESKSHVIRKLEEQVNNQLKKQGKVSNDLKELTKLKATLMNEIVQNMDEMQDERKEALRQKKLEKSRRLIEDINDKLEACQLQQDELPAELRRANEELMLASAEDCYARIQMNEQELVELTAWINKTRIELKRRILIKQEKEDMNQRLYSYLHDMLGPDFMEVFDRRHK